MINPKYISQIEEEQSNFEDYFKEHEEEIIQIIDEEEIEMELNGEQGEDFRIVFEELRQKYCV